MDLAEYEHMKKVCDYVFSSPPNSPEREKRLAEISKEDDEKLWDFYSGLCSGRIKRPETQNKESEESKMNVYTGKTKKIENYEDFKRALVRTGTYQSLLELKRSDPARYESYQQRLEKENKAR